MFVAVPPSAPKYTLEAVVGVTPISAKVTEHSVAPLPKVKRHGTSLTFNNTVFFSFPLLGVAVNLIPLYAVRLLFVEVMRFVPLALTAVMLSVPLVRVEPSA